jgi:hypothetical protein
MSMLSDTGGGHNNINTKKPRNRIVLAILKELHLATLNFPFVYNL